MSDDPSSSSATRAGNANDTNNNASLSGQGRRLGRDGDEGDTRTSRDGRRRKKGKKKHPPGLVKKLSFVTHLLQGLDYLVFAELSALYYMECVLRPRREEFGLTFTRCSFFRLLIRAISQMLFLSPKDISFPFSIPASRIHVAMILLSNSWCVLVHLLASLPVGKEYHRGYQHGGMIIDFIGQKPPTYRAYYLLADLLVFLLQCLMLTIHTEREKLRLLLKTFKPLNPARAPDVADAPRTIEDLDAEEQGIRSTDQPFEDEANGAIEMTPVRSSRESRRASRRSRRDSASRFSDSLQSGNAILDEYHVVNCIRVATTSVESAAADLQNIGYRTTLFALDARRRGLYNLERRNQQANTDMET